MKLKYNIFFTIILSPPIIYLIYENFIKGETETLMKNLSLSILVLVTLGILWFSYYLGNKY